MDPLNDLMPVSGRDAAVFFKAQLKSYLPVRRMIAWCDKRLIEIQMEMNGLTGISYEESVSSSGFDSGAKSAHWYSLMADKEALLEDRSMYSLSLKAITTCVSDKLRLFKPEDRDLLIRIYMNGEKITDIAKEIPCDESLIRRRVNNAIEEVFLGRNG